MGNFIDAVKSRNEVLFFFGLICFIATIAFFALAKTTTNEVSGVNAWYKPFKFSFSTFLYAWTIAWFCAYLPPSTYKPIFFNWSLVILLGFEIIYIAIQAGRGQLSHFNISTPFYSAMFSLMAFAATAVALLTAYMGILFCTQSFPDLPEYYVWGIRIGILVFVIFCFEGFAMGSRMAHTVGGTDGSAGIPILNWSMKYGDLRIAHFIGMHGLQVIPLLSFYAFKNTRLTLLIGLVYGVLAFVVLFQALKGKPLISKSVEWKK